MHRIAYLLLSFILIGCTSSSNPSTSNLVVGISASPSTLDPLRATDAYGMRIVDIVFQSLVKVGPDLSIVGDAAESWSIEGEKYTFILKDHLKFSNGREVLPEDILFSFGIYQRPNTPYASTFNTIKSIQANKEPSGKIKVIVRLDKFKASFLNNDLPILKILPKAEWEASGSQFSTQLVSSGPYSFEDINDQKIVLKANPHFKRTSEFMENITFKVIKDDFTRYQKLKKGELDVVQADLPPSKVKDFESDPDTFTVHKYSGLSMTYLLVNLKDNNLNHLGLRKSIAQAINRKEIIKYKLEGLAQEATSILTPSNPYHAAELTNIPFDFLSAVENIENMGFKDLNLTLKTSNNRAAMENGKVIAQQLNKAGLKVKMESFEWGTFYSDVKNSNFQLATMRWVGVLDPDIYRLAFHSAETPPKGRNRGGYKNTELDTLLEEGLYVSDFNKRKGLYSKVQQTILKELPIIPLWYDEQVAVVHKRVKNYKVALNGDFTPLIGVYK